MVTAVPKEPPTLKKRGSKSLPPQQLYETLCGIFPEEIAAQKFEHLMGYPPMWRKEDNTKLNILPED